MLCIVCIVSPVRLRLNLCDCVCYCLQRLREEILIMKKYFVTCREALESKLLLQVCVELEYNTVLVLIEISLK